MIEKREEREGQRDCGLTGPIIQPATETIELYHLDEPRDAEWLRSGRTNDPACPFVAGLLNLISPYLDQPKMLFQMSFQMSGIYLGDAEYCFSRCNNQAESIQTSHWNTIVPSLQAHQNQLSHAETPPVMLLPFVRCVLQPIDFEWLFTSKVKLKAIVIYKKPSSAGEYG
jgi:hypothetical protein